ncbi:MAG: response regulator [Kofleriaceae bacterium]|nr:response regulator [Kofleriaceae bacterium]
MLESVTEGIVACNETGILVLFNRAAREFHGLLETPIPPAQWAETYSLFRPDGTTPLPTNEVPLLRALGGEVVRDVEMVIAPAGLPMRRVLCNGQALLGEHGQKLGAIVSMHDITKQRRVEEELRKQQFLLQYIINLVPHCVFWKDREGRLLGGNKAFLDKAVRVDSVEKIIGKTDYDFFPPEQADHFRKCDFSVMETGVPMLDIEEPLRQRDGNTRVLITSKVPLRDQQEEIVGVLGSFTDITERKRMEQELATARQAAEAASRAKDEFLSIVSHEVRTPLTLILGPLELLLAAKQLPQEVRTELLRIRRNTTRLYALVSDVLDFAKLGAGKMQANWERVDVNEVISEIVADAETSAREAGLTLVFSAAQDLQTVTLDRRKFEKITLNLLGNALKFTPKGGRIDVRLQTVGTDYELSIQDTGPGIALDKQELLFRRFQQIDATTTRKHEGTGIGLALVKEFAELMGGRVGVESASGKGARFFVRFPRDSDRVIASGTPAASHRTAYPGSERAVTQPLPTTAIERPVEGHKAVVLVVDDNPDMRAYVSEILNTDFTVETAENGVDALAQIDKHAPELVVSDVMMPEMDGHQLVAHLKGDPDRRHIPVILLTARVSREELVRGLELGADDYVGKPFAPAELKARVVAAMRTHRLYLDLQAAVSKLKESQEQLIQSAKLAALGTLIAGLAHELNNPLGAISASVQLMLGEKPLDEPLLRRCLATIQAQTVRCSGLVTSLLEFSRKGPPSWEVFPVETLFKNLEGLAQPMAYQHDIRVDIKNDAAHREMCANRQELETALINLVSNGLDAVPPGGLVSVRAVECTRDGNDGIEIRITDTGSGIPGSILPHIFDPFLHHQGSWQRHWAGAVAHQEHRRVARWTDSHRQRGREGDRRPSLAPAETNGAGMTRVLVVDDDRAMLDVLEMLLTLEGYDVSLADSGPAALELAGVIRFDVALTDLRMPGMSGIETLAGLKQLDPGLPVIVVSAHFSAENVVECKGHGAFEFLKKPFDVEHLRAAAKRAIRSTIEDDAGSAPSGAAPS